MCLLSYFPPKVTPDYGDLEIGTINNPDGSGFAIHAGNHLITYRSMNPDKVLEKFAETRSLYPKGPALFHSRIGTSGLYRKENCHPFIVGGDPRTVMAHNGVLYSPPKSETRSDTRIWAEDVMPRLYFRLDKATVRAQIAKRIGRYNKFVIITANPRYHRSAYIINEAGGSWTDEGVWHSNDSYMPRTAYQVAYRKTACLFCEEYRLGDYSNVCFACGMCNDCFERRQECECWRPRSYTFTSSSDGTTTATAVPPVTSRTYAGTSADDWEPWCDCPVKPLEKAIQVNGNHSDTIYECPRCHTTWTESSMYAELGTAT